MLDYNFFYFSLATFFSSLSLMPSLSAKILTYFTEGKKRSHDFKLKIFSDPSLHLQYCQTFRHLSFLLYQNDICSFFSVLTLLSVLFNSTSPASLYILLIHSSKKSLICLFPLSGTLPNTMPVNKIPRQPCTPHLPFSGSRRG